MAHYFEYVVFQIAGAFLRLFPLPWVRRMGGAAGEFVGTTLGYRRGVTMDNLRNAFPERSDKDLEEIMRGSFRSVGIALFEFVYFPRLSKPAINKVVRIENPEYVSEVYSRGKGLVLLTAHFGNWELLAQSIPAAIGVPVYIIVKPQANRRVDSQINRWRTLYGNFVVPMENAIRELLKALREKQVVGIVADQTAAKESISVSFFGREVPTYEGPAMFSLKTGAPLLLGFAVRTSDGSYRATFHEVPAGDLAEYSKENVAELTRRHVALTESAIRQHPEQWMWMHKRWKHVPSRVSSGNTPVAG